MADFKPPGLVPPKLPDTIAIAKRTVAKPLPLVLAGPILRQVTQQSVTVWLALRASAKVTLQIFNSTGAQVPVVGGQEDTFELGTRLHVVAVTASFSTPLSAGSVYSYNVQFTPSSGAPGDLFAPGILNASGGQTAVQALCYGSFTRPTFVTPPSNLRDVRISHGSCRMPHAESRDALEVLDDILRDAIQADPTSVATRPQQLFMTGDQIYADDVCQVIAALTNDAADYFIGKAEPLPMLGTNLGPAPVTPYGPTTRQEIRDRSGLTTGAGLSHLLSFGDYCAFYLFHWSDTVWPDRFPTYEEIFPQYPRLESNIPAPKPSVPVRKYWAFKDYEHEQVFLNKFRSALPKVRRLFANIATYMAIDDHDVTDDFFMNRAACENLLGSQVAELGKRIHFDGLLSYAFFQAWGNTGPTPNTAFDARIGELQDAYALWRNANYPVDGAEYTGLYDLLDLPINVPQIDPLTDPAAVKIVELDRRTRNPPITPLSYSFRLIWPVHELIALDTRMHRGYPRKRSQNAALASDDSLKAQIGAGTSDDDRVTLVICPRPPREHPIIVWASEGLSSEKKTFERDVESWGQDLTTYETLFSALASRANRRCRAILMSGDVHHGYACRHQYWSDHPFADPQQGTSTPATGVFALFTCSAFKKQITSPIQTIMLHRLGFATFLTRPFDKRKTTRLTWNRQITEPLKIGHATIPGLGGNTFDVDLTAKPGRGVAVIDNLARAMFEAGNLDADETLAHIDTPPDAVAVTTFVASTAPRNNVVAKLDTEGIDNNARFLTFTTFLVASVIGIYDSDAAEGEEIVGANNLGILTFKLDGNNEPTVTQELWWFARDASDNLVARPLSSFPISLALEQKPAV
jgi:hypothetical protein